MYYWFGLYFCSLGCSWCIHCRLSMLWVELFGSAIVFFCEHVDYCIVLVLVVVDVFVFVFVWVYLCALLMLFMWEENVYVLLLLLLLFLPLLLCVERKLKHVKNVVYKKCLQYTQLVEAKKNWTTRRGKQIGECWLICQKCRLAAVVLNARESRFGGEKYVYIKRKDLHSWCYFLVLVFDVECVCVSVCVCVSGWVFVHLFISV